jgi:hypothetical protein
MADNDFTLTKDYLHQIFEYKDGELFRLKNNKKVGSNHIKGYKHTTIKGKPYLNHRLIYMMFYGVIPPEIDHINGNRSDNRIENLRPANNKNQQNAKIRKDNKSGAKGVYWFKELKKWKVDVATNGKRKYIGVFEDLELAELVAQEARNKYHGKFAKHN